MKSREEIMNMLEAFDLCGSLRGAGDLAGVSHHTVARYVAERDAGELARNGWSAGTVPLRALSNDAVACSVAGCAWPAVI